MIALLLFLAQIAAPQNLAVATDAPAPQLPPLVATITPTLISMNAFASGPLPSEAYTIVSLWPTGNGSIQVGLDATGNPACGYTGSPDMADDFELSGFPNPCTAGTIAQPLATVTVTAGQFTQP
jgi:hypothetical protein